MKKRFLFVLAIAVTMIIGLGSLASVQGSDVVVSKPGITVVNDPAGDLLLRNCDPNLPNTRCSLPPTWPLELPAYFDIKKAQITEIGRGLVDLAIETYEPIPAAPEDPFIQYFWQFEGGCVGSDPQPGSKAGISVNLKDWDLDGNREWRAYWYEVTGCNPRSTGEAGRIDNITFTATGVKVRVKLSDLMTAADPGQPLIWHVGVRRLPFIYSLGGVPMKTIAVDFAPDVVDLDPIPPPPPPYPAEWDPR